MSTEIFEKGKMIITRFSGGIKNGMMLQIRIDDKYEKFTAKEITELALVLLSFLANKVKSDHTIWYGGDKQPASGKKRGRG